MEEYFRQPVVDTFDISICTAKSQRHVIDFQTADETELHRIEIPLEFHMLSSGNQILLNVVFSSSLIYSALKGQ